MKTFLSQKYKSSTTIVQRLSVFGVVPCLKEKDPMKYVLKRFVNFKFSFPMIVEF